MIGVNDATPGERAEGPVDSVPGGFGCSHAPDGRGSAAGKGRSEVAAEREDVQLRFAERRRLPRGLDATVLVLTAACVVSVPFLLGRTGTDEVASWAGLLLLLGIVPLLIAGIHSRVTVAEGHLALALVPLWRKRLPLDGLTGVRQQTVRARDMGGLGLRRTSDGATALVMRGTLAVEVVTRDGKRYVIGTDRPEELTSALSPPPPGAKRSGRR